MNTSVVTDRSARRALTVLAEPADPVINALLATASAVQVLEMITTGTFVNLGDAIPALAVRRTLSRCRGKLDQIPSPGQVECWERAGIRLICPGDPEWPARLDDLGRQMPYALWLRGTADLRFACRRSVAIAGSRACTAYGSYVAGQMASDLACDGWTVVSGAAYGIDAAAHQGALGAGGTTVAVLPCGVDTPCPPGHRHLLDAIADDGAVVSEFPPGRTPSRSRFLVRNRVIAALSAGTLIVEAGQHGGSMNTARHARDLGRTLMAVPGPVTSEQSAGCHSLIRDRNAALVTSADDVKTLLTPEPGADT